MFIWVELSSLFVKKRKVHYVTQVLKQGNNIKMMCLNYILQFRNTKSHLFQVYLGTLANIETVIENLLLNCWSLIHLFLALS